MSWRTTICYLASCDRCNAEMEDYDTGGDVHFEAPRIPTDWSWYQVTDGEKTAIICPSCWEQLGADDWVLAEAARWEQDGPDLFEGSRS